MSLVTSQSTAPNSALQRGLVVWDESTRCITFEAVKGTSATASPISLDRIQTPADLINMIAHMKEKSWFTDQHLADFVTLAMTLCNYPRFVA